MINKTLLPLEEFTTRREKLMAQMPNHSIAIIAANSEVTRSNDTEYPFCQDKNFYYLTGFNEPDAVIVLIKGSTNSQIIFCREKNPLQEVWHGRRIGPEKAALSFAFDHGFTLAHLDELLPDYLADLESIWHCHNVNAPIEETINSALTKVKAQVRQGISAPNARFDCADIIHEMRLIKSDGEIAIMREANIISGKAHQRAMNKCKVGLNEYHVEAELHYVFASHGAKNPAYGSIVAGGDNANILHYTENSDELKDNELLLIDAGCELAGYAADITRTFPINGKFNTEQKALYQLVLEAKKQCIDAVKPGVSFAQLNDICHQVLTQGLIDLGIIEGDYQVLLEQKECKKYFIHGLGHWLGLDVHDVGNYQIEERRQMRAFEAGMAFTIEPGLYIPLDDLSVDEKWRGLAVRIEDNIVVTKSGYENLTVNSPEEIDDIEALMAN